MRALVSSGGAEKSAFGAGILKHLLGDLKINYDIYTGSSSGAINAAFLSQYSAGQEQEAANKLYDLWLNLKPEDIYKEWFGGRIMGLWKASFLNSKPLAKLIERTISLKKIRASGKQVYVSAVSIETGKTHFFNQTSDNFIKAVIGSCSFPGAFLPAKFNGLSWVDGAIKSHTPISTALEMGADHIDVIMTSPELRVKRFNNNPTAIDILYRSLDLSTDKIMSNDIEKIELYNKLAAAGLSNKKEVKIQILRPSQNLTDNILKFDPGEIKSMLDIGYMEAKKKFVL